MKKFVPDYWVVLVLILLLIGASQFFILKDLKTLPSPLFGGDYYNHLGGMYHIIDGGNILKNDEMNDGVPWVPWLYNLIIVVFSFFGLFDIVKVNLLMSSVFMMLSALIFYFLGKKLFNKTIGLIAASTVGISGLIIKYTPFSAWVVMPLFFLVFVNFYEKQNWKNSILLGLVIGLAGLSNVQSFIFVALFMSVFTLWWLFKNKFRNFKYFLLAGVIGVVISLVYWYYPLFVMGGKTLNPIQIYGWFDFSYINNYFYYLFILFSKTFFNTESVIKFIIGFGGLLGLIISIFSNKIMRYITVISSFVALHYFITIPLLGTHFSPDRVAQMGFTTLVSLGFGVFLYFLFSKITKKYLTILGRYVSLLLVFIICLQNIYSMDNDVINAAKYPLPENLKEFQNYVRNNIGVNEVILANNEGSFMMHALTGRKSVCFRRTHASPYIDMDMRNLDCAILFYGNDSIKRMQLIEKYNISYVIFYKGQLFNEILFNGSTIIHMFDPYEWPTDYNKTMELKKYGVDSLEMYHYLDPAFLTTYPRYNITVVLPYKYSQAYHPSFEDLFIPVFSNEDVVIFKLRRN